MPLDHADRSFPATAGRRFVSLDIFRGMSVAAMLLVNDPGDWGAIYWPLRHAEWQGWTPTDLIFPFFLFMVGITTRLSLGHHRAVGAGQAALMRQIFRRAAILFLLGLFLNWFPGFTPGPGSGDGMNRIADRLLHLRLPGVLQRIAIVYALAAVLTLKTPLRLQILLIPTILLVYWLLLMGIPVPGSGATGLAAIATPAGTLAAALDRALFDWGPLGNHLWDQGLTWDPEGLLSTLPALATTLLGAAAGAWIGCRLPLDRRIAGLALAGVGGIFLGLLWNQGFPINKNLWTSSYVLLSGGGAALALAATMALVEQAGLTGWARPFLPFGVNPILAYAGSEITAVLIYEVIPMPDAGHQVALQAWIYRHGFLSWLQPADASLVFALLFVAVWWVILAGLHRRGIIVKI